MNEFSKLAINIMHFARSLRLAGLPIGSGKIVDATRAAEISGLRSPEDFYWALHGIFVSKREHELIFKQGFHIFWKRPELLEQLLERGLSLSPGETKSAGSRRLADAMALRNFGVAVEKNGDSESYGGVSDAEAFRTLDFEKMSAQEIAEAKLAIKGLALPVVERKKRRLVPSSKGPLVDLRSTMRNSLKTGGSVVQLRYRKLKKQAPPLVVICDVSGSMAMYSRLLLHFVHALANGTERVHSFVFGTRLTNITKCLLERDVDVALESAQEFVQDWSGGTRIGPCLRNFNHRWSRRVLGQGGVIILISDGLDRDDGLSLGQEMERLHKSCKQLIWLNPLLRYSEFEPKAVGIKAMLPHVDVFRPVHNLASVADLAQALTKDGSNSWIPPVQVKHGS